MSPDGAARPFVIVGGLDGSGSVEDPVVAAASGLARLVPAAELHLLHAIDLPAVVDPPYLPPYLPPTAALLSEGRATMLRLVRQVARGAPGKVEGHVVLGAAAPELLAHAHAVEADLLVVGSHPRSGLLRAIGGSVSERVVRLARCPVLVARPTSYPTSPAVEPPCLGCVRVQRATHGDQRWCEQHVAHRARGHLHYELPQPFGVGSTFFRP